MNYKNFKQYLNEMAQNIGKPYSPLQHATGWQEHLYTKSSKLPVLFRILGIDIDGVHGANTLELFANIENKTVYHAKFSKHQPDDICKTLYLVQDEVDKTRDNSTPKGFAGDVLIQVCIKYNTPIRTSSSQFTAGNDMWKSIIAKAVGDHLFVYFYNGEKLSRILNTPDYFGKSEKYLSKHVILSPFDLDK